MQTSIPEATRNTAEGREADRILRSCVHCGFCTATCPTYQLLGDELDGPRGRIYLIKAVLEEQESGRTTQLHLDRCLTCRACETTCPSGVEYGRLLDIGRQRVDADVARPLHERLLRRALRAIIPYPSRFGLLLRLGQRLRPVLPPPLRALVPPRQPRDYWSNVSRQRRMLALDGCVQPLLAPAINAAASRVFARLGIELVRAEGEVCCGAVSHHLGAGEEALAFARRNIDAWWPHLTNGAEAIVVTASGCGSMVKEYGYLLRNDAAYAEKAARVSALARDPVEVLDGEAPGTLQRAPSAPQRIAFQSPCTLQHGQRLGGRTERLLAGLGFELTPVPDAHLCCGSAGTYSILQRKLAQRLRNGKITALESGTPELIATANIGCYTHLQAGTALQVRHWLELLDA